MAFYSLSYKGFLKDCAEPLSKAEALLPYGNQPTRNNQIKLK